MHIPYMGCSQLEKTAELGPGKTLLDSLTPGKTQASATELPLVYTTLPGL